MVDTLGMSRSRRVVRTWGTWTGGNLAQGEVLDVEVIKFGTCGRGVKEGEFDVKQKVQY